MGTAYGLHIGGPHFVDLSAAVTYASHTLDANTERCAYVFNVLESATITHVGFRYGARTGTPPTYRISLQALGTDGSPDGTVLGGGSPASTTFTPPADATINGLWQEKALDNSFAVTRGQFLAIVIDHSSGTIDGANFSTFTAGALGTVIARTGFPYTSLYTGTWARTTNALPLFSLRASGTGAVYGTPWQASADTTLGTSGHRAALKFNLPTSMGSTFKAAGLSFCGTGPAAANTWTIGIWDAAGALLQSVSVDSDVEASVASAVRSHTFYFTDVTLPTLSFGTTYYAGIQRAASNCALAGFAVAAAGDLYPYPLGTTAYLSTWDGAAWSDAMTTRPFLELILDDITVPGGGNKFWIFGPKA